eukprot:2361140-Ditylum_brightwellii.AAC.1
MRLIPVCTTDGPVWGPKEIIKAEFDAFNERFDCNNVGEVEEYMGCKISKEDDGASFKITQLVPIQSLEDEF